MKLPTIKKILREDVKDAPAWIAGVIDPVNSFMENVYTALNKAITLTDNIASFTKEISYVTLAGYPGTQPNVTFLNQLRTRATGVMVMQAFETQSYTPVAIGGLAWVEDTSGIVIYPISGLTASKTYTLRLVVF